MNFKHTLSQPARDFLVGRLDLLHEALLDLGRRLRESAASVVGAHVGDAVRDALRSALLHQSLDEALPDTRPRHPFYREESHLADRVDRWTDRRGWQDGWDAGDEFSRRDDGWGDHRTLPREPTFQPHDGVVPASRWVSFLAEALPLLGWLLPTRGARRPLRALLGAAGGAGLTALGSPVAGLVLITGGLALLLARRCRGLRTVLDRADLVTP